MTLALGILLWAAWPPSAIWSLDFALSVADPARLDDCVFALTVRAVGRIIPIRRVA